MDGVKFISDQCRPPTDYSKLGLLFADLGNCEGVTERQCLKEEIHDAYLLPSSGYQHAQNNSDVFERDQEDNQANMSPEGKGKWQALKLLLPRE